MKSPILTLAGAVLAATAVSACGSTATTPGAATTPADSASKDAGSPSPSTAPAADTSQAAGSAAGSTDKEAYATALAAWKQAARAPMATVNTYVARAGAALKGASDPAYVDASAELIELSDLPLHGLTGEQQATASKDATDLDRFFGTPGLMAAPADGGSGTSSGATKKTAACTASDLRFTVTEESQKGGYYLLTASARPGVTCTLGNALPAVMFGSSPESLAHPAEQSLGEPIRLSGSQKAYAGVNPRSVDSDAEADYSQVIVGPTNDDPNPVALHLATPAPVNAPLVTDWHTDPDQPVTYL